MSETKSGSTVTLTVDGREVTVPKGTTILKAAEALGTKVPHYCYHDGLSAPAMCRLCLVEVEGAPKPQPSCVTQAQDGQVVLTDSTMARSMREGVLEFYLLNHPLDCPICDRAGECFFQDYVHAEGPDRGRSREPKRVFGRDDFGADVLYYGDRCVMCTRCVRFMDEVEREPRLTVVERGSRSVIDTFFDDGLEGTKWSGNIVDICPVGALVSKDFLHKQRAWDLDHTPSVCPGCSQGCNISLHSRDNLIQRIKPRANLDLNAFWMCDYGRLDYEWMNRGDRLEAPLVRDGEATTAMGWSEALAALSARLDDVGDATVRAVASPRSSNEDLAAFAALVEHLGGGPIEYRLPMSPDEDVLKGMPTLARRRELAPNHRGADLMGCTRVGDARAAGGIEATARHDGIVLVLGDALEDQDAEFASGAGLYVFFGTHGAEASKAAHFVLPVSTFAEQEGTFTNRDGRVQRFWPALQVPGATRPAWLVIRTLLAQRTESAPPGTAAEAFAQAAVEQTAFDGLSYEQIGARGVMIGQPSALPGG